MCAFQERVMPAFQENQSALLVIEATPDSHPCPEVVFAQTCDKRIAGTMKDRRKQPSLLHLPCSLS